MRTKHACSIALLSSFIVAHAVAGGPLTPPPGPIAETPGPEPRTAINDLPGNAIAQHVINKPGSYYFSGDIEVATAGLHGVYIDTPGPVTIDGMGFTLRGAAGTLNAFVIFDNTGVPLRAKLQNMHSAGFDAWAVKWVGPSDSNSPEEDAVEFEDIDALVAGSSGVAVHWHGDITLKRGYIDNGGIFQADGALTIADTIIHGHPNAPAIEADGLHMTNVETRGGRGVVAKKAREIVVVGSKVKEVVRGVALDLAEGAVVTGTQTEGTVDAHDYALWRENVVTVDAGDPFYAPLRFGAGSVIEASTFHVIGSAITTQPAVECSEEVAFYYNKIAFNYASMAPPSPRLLFTGGGSTIVGNTVNGVPAGGAGFEVNDNFNVMHGNVIIGSGTASIAVVGTASQSIFRNNETLNVGLAFDLFGAGGNHIGPTLSPSAASTNMHPDRNLLMVPAGPTQ